MLVNSGSAGNSSAFHKFNWPTPIVVFHCPPRLRNICIHNYSSYYIASWIHGGQRLTGDQIHHPSQMAKSGSNGP